MKAPNNSKFTFSCTPKIQNPPSKKFIIDQINLKIIFPFQSLCKITSSQTFIFKKILIKNFIQFLVKLNFQKKKENFPLFCIPQITNKILLQEFSFFLFLDLTCKLFCCFLFKSFFLEGSS